MEAGIDPELLEKIDPKFREDSLFLALAAEGLAIQDRFSAEPVYARTGKGYLKSAGVEELRQIKESLEKSQASAPRHRVRRRAGNRGTPPSPA